MGKVLYKKIDFLYLPLTCNCLLANGVVPESGFVLQWFYQREARDFILIQVITKTLRRLWERLPRNWTRNGSLWNIVSVEVHGAKRQSAFRLSVMKPKPTLLIKRLIRRKENISNGQWELLMKAYRLPKARENAGDQVVIDFSLAFDWSRVACVFWTNHRAKWSKTNFWIPFDRKFVYHTSLNLFTWTVWNEIHFFMLSIKRVYCFRLSTI